MVSSTRQAIACILVIFGATIHIQSQTVPIKGPTASISGKVIIKGKGLPGIAVGLRLMESSSQHSTRYKAITDDQGNYRITNVPPGNYQVVTVAPAFISSEDQGRGKTLIITKDETIENIDFTLIRGGVITGRVTDSDGRPVVEEEVSLHPVQMNNRYLYMTSGRRTDDRGIYRIFGVPPGNYRVAAGQREDASFGGRMQNTSYKLTFHPAAAEISQGGLIEVTEGSEATNVDITLGRTLVKYSARGRIVDGETGRPLANVPYGLNIFISENSTGSMTTGAVSNTEGEFKLDNLTPGKYGVFIGRQADSEWRADLVRFEVVDRDVTGLIVKTSKGAGVSGVIVLEGTDDKDAHANLKKTRLHTYLMNENLPGNSGQSATINPDGSFRLTGLPAGLLGFSLFDRDRFHIVRVEREGIVYPKGVEIKEGEQLSGVRVVVNYANGTIRGVVKFESGTLPPNASVYVVLKRIGDDPGSLTSSSHESAQVDARGQFFKEALIPGMYEVSGGIYIPGSRGPLLSQTKQQVVVVDGGVTNVTLTVNLNSTTGRP